MISRAWRTERSVLIVLGVAAFGFLGIGASWDHHWHAAVGRDALISPPHVVVYLGTLLSAAAAAAGRAFVRGRGGSAGRTGYRVVLRGAAIMAVAAIFDEIWHRTIGDATIWSPPHVLGILGGIIIAAGTVRALFEASRDGVLSRQMGDAVRNGFPAMLLVAAYFGVLPAAVLAFAPTRVEYAFFTLMSPYIVAAIAALLIPALVSVSASPGGGGWRFTVWVALGWWTIQEALSLVVTPVAAKIFDYRMLPNPFPDVWFDLVALTFMLVPALLAAPLIIRRPRLGGAVCALGYAAAVLVGLAFAGLPLEVSGLAVAGPVAIGTISAPAGVHVGRWLHRQSAVQ